MKRPIMPIIDDIDKRILAILQEDGRISNLDLSDQVGLSPSPCLRRLRNLEKDGLIDRYVAVLDQTKAGFPVSVFISVKLEKQLDTKLAEFENTVRSYPEVLECYLMTGSQDYHLRVVATDLAAYERFLKTKLTRLENIASIESSFALQQVKYTNKLPLL